jgi:flagellar basal body-associated protein FliL
MPQFHLGECESGKRNESMKAIITLTGATAMAASMIAVTVTASNNQRAEAYQPPVQ